MEVFIQLFRKTFYVFRETLKHFKIQLTLGNLLFICFSETPLNKLFIFIKLKKYIFMCI